jgi:spore coat polysaccharide biosynthesis predicted glycosyltransferase SpsG
VKVLYRADGGHPIGTGHIFRAVRLLRALAERTELDALLMVAEDDFAVRVAQTAPARLAVLPPRRDLTAVKPLLTAAPVLAALSREPFDLVVVDMLDTPEDDIAALAEAGIPLATFDDRGPGRLYADAIINILIEEPEPDRLRPRTRLYQGGPYVVLDPLFANLEPIRREFGPRCRVFVGMGGADAAGLTVKAARALLLVPGLTEAAFVNGPAFPHRAELDAALEKAPWPHKVYTGLPNLLDLYRRCDLAVVAGGLTMYECCRTGTPSLAVPQPIDHQFELAQALSQAGAMATVGDGLETPVERIAEEVGRLAHDPEARRRMSERGPALVDGRGTERVAEALIEAARRFR